MVFDDVEREYAICEHKNARAYRQAHRSCHQPFMTPFSPQIFTIRSSVSGSGRYRENDSRLPGRLTSDQALELRRHYTGLHLSNSGTVGYSSESESTALAHQIVYHSQQKPHS